MTERLGAFTLQERQRRILERAAAIGWPVSSANGVCLGNETLWRREVTAGLPGVLDEIERRLPELEAKFDRSAAIHQQFADEDRRRNEAAAETQAHQDAELSRRLNRRGR